MKRRKRSKLLDLLYVVEMIRDKEMEGLNEFHSEYASVRYIQNNQVVYLVWKKEAHLENYRTPTLFALDMLRQYKGSNFIVDARNGFEDDKQDVEWGFSYLLPEMAKTSCRFVSFIMERENEIEDEMDMWTVEFGKYFAVTRATDYEKALRSTRNYLLAKVRYRIKDGKREEFLRKVQEEKIIESSKQEPGNIQYECSLPIDSSNDVCLIEMWTNQNEQKRHGTTAHYGTLSEIKKDYVEGVSINCYQMEEI